MFSLLRIAVLSLLLGACGPCEGERAEPEPPPVAEPDALDSARVLAEVRRALDQLDTYEARLSLAHRIEAMPDEPVTMRTHVQVSLPNRMRLTTSMLSPEGERPPMSIVYDGQTIWIVPPREDVSVGEEPPPITRFDQRRLVTPGRSFDAVIAATGSGLLRGEDLVGTVRRYLDRYTFEDRATLERDGGRTYYELTGVMTPGDAVAVEMSDARAVGGLVDALRNAPDETFREGVLRMHAQGLSAMQHFVLWVDAETSLPTRWTLGRDPPASDVRVVALEKVRAHPPETFAVPEEDRAAAVDQTDRALEIERRLETLAADRAAVTAARDDLMAALRALEPP